LAIFNLHELEPISMAAKVGMIFSSTPTAEINLCCQHTRPDRVSAVSSGAAGGMEAQEGIPCALGFLP